MANIVELKDGSGTKAYPITKGEATYYNGTTTVNKKIDDEVDKSRTGGTILPILIGDYIVDNNYLPSAVVKVGSRFYTFNAPTFDYAMANRTNVGKLRVFDVNTNAEVTDLALDIELGHANGACYNPVEEAIYVNPMGDFSDGTYVKTSFLYKYDLTFSSVSEIVTPSHVWSVAFDYATNTMYYLSISDEIPRKIYKYSNGSWVFCSTLDLSGINTSLIGSVYKTTYDQCFAVKDGMFYISCSRGNVAYGRINEGGTSRPIGSYLVAHIDSGYQMRIGELEGWEFDEDGHLYACHYTTLTGSCRNGFVTEIPIGGAFYLSNAGSLYSVHSATQNLIGLSDTKFSLNYDDIRTLNQLRAKVKRVNNIVVQAGTTVVEPYLIIIDDSIAIQLYGELDVSEVQIQRGTLTINASSNNNLIKTLSTNRPIFSFVERSVGLRFVGNSQLNVDLNGSTLTESNFVNIGSSFGHITTRLIPRCIDNVTPLYIAQTKIMQYSFYIGQRNLAYLNDNTYTINVASSFAGYISSASKIISFFIPIERMNTLRTTNVTIQQGKVYVRGIPGYIVSSGYSDPIDLTTAPATVTVKATGVEVSLDYSSAVADIEYNNTPVTVTVANDITLAFEYSV